jgi:starch-binding outer membrane protein, SusD/RagB family
MKRSIVYILFAAGVIAAGGCKKFLEQQPVSDIAAENFWKTPDDARLGVAAMYDGIQKTLNGNYTDWGDARSDNFTYGGTGENQITVVLNGINSLNGAANWGNLYMTIGRANAAIKYIPKITPMSEILRNHYLSQAYGVRAYMYFYGVRLWGGLPVRLQPYEAIEENLQIPRSPADSILNNIIIPDLLKAYELTDRTVTTPYEITTSGILAMLTEVYMWKKDYAGALDASDKLLKLPFKYDVNAGTGAAWKEIFLNPLNNKEAIWTLNWSSVTDGGNGISKIGSGGNTSQYYIDSTVFLRLEANKNDIRRGITYDTVVVNANERVIQIVKLHPIVISTSGNNIGRHVLPINDNNEAKLPLYRTADILLLRAEALNMTSADKTGVFAIVNKIRNLRKATPLVATDYPTDRDVEKAILDERQLELFGEGKRWFDLARTGRVIEVMDPLIRLRQSRLNIGQTGFDDPRKILWPISREALTRNTALKQNPPYSE